MEYESHDMHGARAYAQGQISQGVMAKVFWWMAIGLGLTGAIAMVASMSEPLMRLVLETPLYWVLLIGEVGLVIALSAALTRLSPAVAAGMFVFYAALNGLTMAVIFLMYTKASIATTFFISGGMFGGMALYGTVTKRDLTSFGSFFFMALIGFIIASVVNIFLKSSMLHWLLTFGGIALFLGLTAYDVQKIRKLAANGELGEDKLAIYGALTLYLDFINLFLLLLRLFGRRR